MRRGLTVFGVLVLLAMVAVSAWATLRIPIGDAIRDLAAAPGAGTNPWFVATLFDTYFAFAWFWLWVAYKETSNVARGVWLVLILGLGNLAMAAYVLIQLRRLPAGAGAEQLLLRRA